MFRLSLPDQSLSKHLLDHFEHLALTDITPKVISEYKFKRLEEEAAPKTVLNELVLLGHVFTLAAGEWELVNENPVKRVRKPTIDNKIDRWLTCDEETKLLNASPRWLKEIILFAVNTGLRQSEILDLQWSHVDLFRKTPLYLGAEKQGKGHVAAEWSGPQCAQAEGTGTPACEQLRLCQYGR
ncbi:MAG TPA: hypothetical protein DCZ04_11660 [Syntrophorhabdus aromaticivorans]|nr:hypothetical protein [Syntrophorhabdus aromaticivorans]